jgi:hypothetical protein
MRRGRNAPFVGWRVVHVHVQYQRQKKKRDPLKMTGPGCLGFSVGKLDLWYDGGVADAEQVIGEWLSADSGCQQIKNGPRF